MGPRPEEKATAQNDMAQGLDDTDKPSNNDTSREEGTDAWAVDKGYTPLCGVDSDGSSDRFSNLIFSTGPDHSNKNYRRNSNTDSGLSFKNPDAFWNSNGADISPTLCNRAEDLDFEEITASALLALDEEYQQIISLSPAISSNQKHDKDLKIAATGLDPREEEEQGIGEQSIFIAQWEEVDGKSSISVIDKDQEQKRQQNSHDDVDTDAVRKVIESLSVKYKDSPFQQKFAIWQQNQHRIDPHVLIPTISYQAFHEPTPSVRARLTTANFSRSATLAEAVVRLSILSSFKGESLLIDIVGVDHVECESALTIRKTFLPFVRWLQDYFMTSQRDRKIHVHFRLIGRELYTADEAIVDVLDSSSSPSSTLRATATCHSGVYHHFLEEIREASAKSKKHRDLNFWGAKAIPNLAVAFNAGVWGYKEWADTFQYLARQRHTTTTIQAAEVDDKNVACRGLPIVITAYTLDECEEDQEVISQSVTSIKDGTKKNANTSDLYRAEILWESESNPYGSQVIRETKCSPQKNRENAYWQAWLLGGKTSCSA